MPSRSPEAPPRPIAAGDVVAAYSEFLGEWTAAQITCLDPDWKTADVLELNWSGPEPDSVADLGDVAPLRLTHHSHNGRLSHCNYDWVLPRSHKVLGAMPLLHAEPSRRYSSGWDLGRQLALQRRWDSGDREPYSDPHELECTGTELNQALDMRTEPRGDIWRLTVTAIESLDSERLAEGFPNLTELSVSGDVGGLSKAAGLNRLASLKSLFIVGLFGMSEADCLLPRCVPCLEYLVLHNIPHDYAAAMRTTWRPEIGNGTSIHISGARKPEWVTENMTNPLRDWDGREHISSVRYKKATAQFKATRKAVLATLSDPNVEGRSARLVKLGRDFGEAFNKLDGRTPFIETVERDELFEALDGIVTEAEATVGVDLTSAREDLASGVEDVREW